MHCFKKWDTQLSSFAVKSIHSKGSLLTTSSKLLNEIQVVIALAASTVYT